jgi:hypothetical protein
MTEHMGAVVEIWPVAADTEGIWLLSGDDAWRSDRIPADGQPQAEVEYVLWSRGAAERTEFAHSTSWRVDGPHIVLTYIAVVSVDELVRDTWPSASPISARLANVVGPATSGPALSEPVPRHIDVLFHGIRHLRFLLDTDATAQRALIDPWPRHLARLQPALAGMYTAEEEPIILRNAHEAFGGE